MSAPTVTPGDDYRALVCVTTCQRLDYLRRHLPHFAEFCAQDPRFSLAVAIDGSEPDTLAFCKRWSIPAVYSDAREGVGLSKNRALKCFSGFDYYFFIEDDVELVNGAVLPHHIDLFRASGIHHFSLFARGGARKPIGTATILGDRVVHCLYGAASFNFFTAAGLERVGGWHPLFGRYRRWGHTEHSYRFVQTGLAPAPFNVAEDWDSALIWHVPPAVTRISGVPFDADQIAAPERTLINEHLSHLPVQTLSAYHCNEMPFGRAASLASQLAPGSRYPLIHGRDRRHARSDFELWRARNAGTRIDQALGMLGAIGRWPTNPALRHTVKMALRK